MNDEDLLNDLAKITLPSIIWASEAGFKWDEGTVVFALQEHKIDIATWILENDADIACDAIDAAIELKEPFIAKWLRDYGCPYKERGKVNISILWKALGY